MPWIDIKKAKLVEGECYSIRAKRTEGNARFFPYMAPGEHEYKVNCVRFIKRKMQKRGGRWRNVNDAGGILKFEFLDPPFNYEDAWGPPPIEDIILLYTEGIEIKPTMCMTPKTREKHEAATAIQSRFRGEKSRLTSKVEGRMTRKEKIKEWPKMKRTLQAQGWTPGEILDFAENSYLIERGDTPERSRRSIAEKHGMKKKKKSKKKKPKKKTVRK